MAIAASQSRFWTRRGDLSARKPNTSSSSTAITGWTRLRLLTRSAASWNPKPRIMHKIPANQMGFRISARINLRLRDSSPVSGAAAKRWLTEADAVNTLATNASTTPSITGLSVLFGVLPTVPRAKTASDALPGSYRVQPEDPQIDSPRSIPPGRQA